MSQIQAFKPTPFSEKDAAGSVKAFQLPSKPSTPEGEVSADALQQYDASEVETETVSSTSNVSAEEDWFVFEEPAEEHH